MSQVIEVLNNVVQGVHPCASDECAKKLFKKICLENVEDAKQFDGEDWEEVLDEGYLFLDGGEGSICLVLGD